MLILNIILFASFVGLAVIITKHKITNPAMRVRFFEDLERNKKRIKTLLSYLGNLGSFLQKFFQILWSFLLRGVKNLLPYGKILFHGAKKGIGLFCKDVKRVILLGKDRVIRQVAELREDMRTFEVPTHKKDFLERLHEEKEASVPLSIVKEPDKEITSPIKEEDILAEKSLGGFHVHKLEAQRPVREVEIDKRILQRKEQGLLDAIVKNPQNPNFYKKLGKVYLLMNNVQDARNCFEYAVKLGAQDPEVKSLLLEIKKETARS